MCVCACVVWCCDGSVVMVDRRQWTDRLMVGVVDVHKVHGCMFLVLFVHLVNGVHHLSSPSTIVHTSTRSCGVKLSGGMNGLSSNHN